MAKRIWRGDAPDIPQIDVVEFDADAIVAEGSDLVFTINDKQIVVEAPASVADLSPEVEGDTHGVPTLLAAAAAAINGSEIPEFAEIEAAVEIPDPSLEAPYHRLTLTGREPGRPFTVDVTAPHPTIDVDVLQVGGPGQNERQRFWIAPTPAGGTYTVAWNFGSGLETSAVVAHNAPTAALKAALVAGMPSLTVDDILVSGAGTTASPFVLELTGALAETNVLPLSVDVSALTGNGQVSIETLVDGGTLLSDAGEVLFDDTFTDTNGTNLTDHTSDSAHTYVEVGSGSGSQAAISSNQLVAAGVNRKYAIDGVLPADFAISADFTLPAHSPGEFGYAGFWLRGADPDNSYWVVTFLKNPSMNTYTLGLGPEYQPGTYTIGTGYQPGQTYNVQVSTLGSRWQITTPLHSKTLGPGLNQNAEEIVHGLVFLTASLGTVRVDNLRLLGLTVANETLRVWTNGVGGTFTLSKPGGSTTAALSPGASQAQLKTQLESVYGGTWTVTGSGAAADPWIAAAGGALAGVDQVQPTGDGSLLTGGFEAPVQTLQHGSPPRPQQWNVVLHGATGGAWRLEFLGRLTAALDHDADATAVEAALVGLEPGDFGGLFGVRGVGSFADPYVIEVAGRLAGSAQGLIAHNEQLTGMGQSLTHSTRQPATGRHWWDHPANWREFETGAPGVPETGDDVWVQTGDDSNSILYGLLQSAVKLNSFVKSSLFGGSIGLPLRTESGYVEYRPRHLAIGFAADGDQTLLIGNDRGQGSGRINLDTGTDEVHIRVERTDGPREPGFQALNWRGTNAANTLTLIEGFVGIAAFAFETAQLAEIVQRGGVLQLGPGTAIASGGLDKTSGDLYSDGATIGGVPLIIRG